MKVRLVLVACCALAVVACSEETPPAQPGSFDRPTQLAFVCFDLSAAEDPKPIRLEDCRPGDSTDTEKVLHALVVQSSRGEVAAVDLRRGRTLDSRPDIPGYTFVPTGELPTAIVVAPEHPGVTYVANAGSRDITVLKTRAFRKQAAKENTTLQTVRLPGDARNAPFDMVLSPDEDALFVSQPQAGVLLRLPIQRCDDSADPACQGLIDEAAIQSIALTASIERVSAPTAQPPEREAYVRTCSIEPPSSAAISAMLPANAADLVPRPSGLAIDSFCERDTSCPRRLLVADATLALIHVIDLDALGDDAADPNAAVQAPILTGAPTRRVVATPRVPVSVGEDAAETHYVYAIDANDGSVIVTQDGAVLQVGMTGARADRITFDTTRTTPVASTLSVLTPAFDELGLAGQWTESVPDDAEPPEVRDDRNFCVDKQHPVRSNRRLRGVFLSVAMTDGSVRIVDVHDMDLLECRTPAACNEDPAPVVRHRARIVAATATDDDDDLVSLAPRASPAFVVDRESIAVRVTGATSDPRVDGLDCVPCSEGLGPAFPDQATADALADAGVNEPGNPVDLPTDSGLTDAAEPLDAAANGGATDAGTADPESPDAGPSEPDPSDEPSSPGSCGAGAARVCALADPWAALDNWSAIYEGVIPGSRGGQGRFAPPGSSLNTTGQVEFLGETRFCSLGVLGSADIGDDRRGDQLTLIGELPPQASIDRAPPDADPDFIESCRALVRARDRTDIPIAFEIREAYDDRLVLEPTLRARPTGLDSDFPASRDIELVNKCFGDMLMTFEVRTLEGYTVVGLGEAGFVHRVKRDEASGRCVVDTTQDARQTARAYGGQPFDNGRVAFQIKDRRLGIDDYLSLGLFSTTPKAILDATNAGGAVVAVVPGDLRWSDTDSMLYMIDVAARGLIEVPVDPFPTSVPTSIR